MLPAELRKAWKLRPKQALEAVREADRLLIRKVRKQVD